VFHIRICLLDLVLRPEISFYFQGEVFEIFAIFLSLFSKNRFNILVWSVTFIYWVNVWFIMCVSTFILIKICLEQSLILLNT